LLILLNLYLSEKCTKKIFPMFSLTNLMGQRHVYQSHHLSLHILFVTPFFTILMAVCVSVQSKCMPPCQWYLHTNASYPCHLHGRPSIPWHRFAFAPVAGESLVGSFCLWDCELDVHFFFQKQAVT